jgi:ubiquinone/menaquinone biosynthesis C-methylase UbiE
LRAPERVALLEVDRVVRFCLDGIQVQTALDVGVGSGVFAEAFAKAGLEVSGIDPVLEMVRSAQMFVPTGTFCQGIAEKLPYPDASVDIVFLGHVLHETDHPLIALQEAKRVARKRVVILEWPYRVEEQGPPIGERLKTEVIEALLRQTGFKNIERPALSHMDLFLLNI